MSLLCCCHVLSRSPGILYFWSGIVRLGDMFYFFGSCRFLCGVRCVVFVQYCFVVACYYLLHVGHTLCFTVFLFSSLWSLCVCGKFARNFTPILVVTSLLYGGLNHVTCLFLFCFLFALWVFVLSCGALNSNLWLYLIFSSASWYGCAALLNMALFDEIAVSLLLMFSDMFLMMFGGWLLCLCAYSGVLFGFMYGLRLPVCKSIVMWRKSAVFRLVSIVIFSLLSLNTFKMSCLILNKV